MWCNYFSKCPIGKKPMEVRLSDAEMVLSCKDMIDLKEAFAELRLREKETCKGGK